MSKPAAASAWTRRRAACGLFVLLGGAAAAQEPVFVAGIVSDLIAAVPTTEIIPDLPVDAIPPIDDPLFIAGDQAPLDDHEIVVGFAVGDEAFAYPIKIMNFHEVVTHVVGGVLVSVTYCPLTNSAAVFPTLGIRFGNSGAIYNNNVVLYDYSTRSLWSQMALGCIFGERAGEPLRLLPVAHGTWGAWKMLHPETRLLSTATGYERDYTVDPYVDFKYTTNSDVYFPQKSEIDRRLDVKEMVFGLARGGAARAYPYSMLAADTAVNDRFDGEEIVLFFSPWARLALGYDRALDGRALHFIPGVESADTLPEFVDLETGSTWNMLGAATAGELAGSQLEAIAAYSAYWFSWASFWQGTDIWSGDDLAEGLDTGVAATTWGEIKASREAADPRLEASTR